MTKKTQLQICCLYIGNRYTSSWEVSEKEPPTVAELEKFDMSSMQWVTEKTSKFNVEKDQFSSGAFRKAFEMPFGRLRYDSRRS